MRQTNQIEALSCLLAFIVLLCPSTNAANILGLFTHPGKSHFDFFRPIFLGLAKAGHDVSVVSYFPNREPVENYTDYQLVGQTILTDVVDIKFFENTFEFDAVPMKFDSFFMLHEWGMESCRIALSSEHVKKILKSNKKYDVVILEQFNNDCMMAVAHKLNAPVIALSSCAIMAWHQRRLGTPMIVSHMPMNFLPLNEKMNFLERLNNFIHYHGINMLYDIFTQRATNELLRQHFGPTIPKIESLIKNTSLMLVNRHYSLAGAVPYTPNVIEVGGLQIQEEAPLNETFKTLLDSEAYKGVIYISWGSMIRPETLSNEKRDALLATTAQFPDYLFLLKWPDNKLLNKPRNLVTRSWMPQRDLLCHPKVRAFMNHGGLLGTSEAVYCGVPMLVTPFYGDQFLNSKAIERRELGVIVKFKNFNQQNIVNALKTILTPSYLKNVQKVSEAYRKRPIKPLDLSLWWIEQVIASKGLPLAQSVAIELNTFTYHSWDVYLAIVGFLIFSILVFIGLIKLFLRILRAITGNQKKKAD